MTILTGLLGMLAVVIAVSLGWRVASRRRQLPCPAWLSWLLDNPFTELAAGTAVTLERIGVQPGERCLDVGSGPGRLSIPAAQRVGPSGSVVAVDVQKEMLARLQRRARAEGVTNVVPTLCDIASDRGFRANDFDRAWLVTVLGEIPDRRAGLQNIFRVLKPGGTLSITEIVGDPHYQRQAVVLRLCAEAGFAPAQYWGGALAFTQNFVKPGSPGGN